MKRLVILASEFMGRISYPAVHATVFNVDCDSSPPGEVPAVLSSMVPEDTLSVNETCNQIIIVTEDANTGDR